jgi:hypothetical protein
MISAPEPFARRSAKANADIDVSEKSMGSRIRLIGIWLFISGHSEKLVCN